MTPPLVTPNRRILVIDDNSAIHADFRKILGEPEAADAELDAFEAKLFGAEENVWFDIDTASQGDEGLAKVRQAQANNRPYAMAFVDVRMPPGWDGIETTRRIWEVDPSLQIVICTAYSDYSWERMQEETTPGDRMLILKKPFDAIEVQQLANTLTEKWRLAREFQAIRDNLDALVEQRTAALHEEMAGRRKLEEKFREQASLLDLARDAILVRDMENRIIYWNKSAELLYGWTAAEAHGCLVSDLLHGDAVRYEEATASLLKHGEWKGEITHRSKDGNEVLVESRWTLVRDADDRPKAVMSINTDITEKKKMEAHFLRSQRIESIGTLAGGIAHDLNNVLLPIMLSIDLLRLTVEDKNQLSILASIEGSAKRGASMVQQVLSFARGVDCERHRISPQNVIQDIRHIVQETFPKNIQLNAEIPEHLPAFMGDATQVHQVLLNLCLNARDAMPGGGKLTVGVGTLNVDDIHAPPGSDIECGMYMVFHVTDNGTGIPPDIKNKIFDPFFTTKELGQGTGLGLSTVMAIIKSHGGFISVDSEPGKGSSFRVHFPLEADAEEAAGTPASEEHSRGHGQLVLLVDDEESVRSITRQTLEAFGYRVITASDGIEAIAQYAEHQTAIEVVLTDMMMPVMDGPATIQILKRMNPDVKIIAASGLTTDAAKAANIGANHYLRKPYTALTLLGVLEQVLNEPA